MGKEKNCTGAISKLLNNHTLRYFINEPEMDVHTKPYTWLLMEASFLMDKPCKKQSRHHATKGWVNRRWIRTVEHCPALQRGELLNHGKIWHNAKCRSRKELSTACSSSVALWGNKRLRRLVDARRWRWVVGVRRMHWWTQRTLDALQLFHMMLSILVDT